MQLTLPAPYRYAFPCCRVEVGRSRFMTGEARSSPRGVAMGSALTYIKTAVPAEAPKRHFCDDDHIILVLSQLCRQCG
jgi:hypothetical protein